MDGCLLARVAFPLQDGRAMARRLALLAVLLAPPSLGLAQTTAFTVNESNDQDSFINIAECSNAVSDTLTFNFTVPFTTTPPANSTFTLVASDKSGCPTDSASGAHNTTISAQIPPTIGTSSASGVFPFSGAAAVQVNNLLNQVGIPSPACSASNTNVFFCVTLSGVTGATTTGNIGVDLQKPPPPVLQSVSPGDGALNVSWTAGAGGIDGGTGTAASYKIVATDPAGNAHTSDPISDPKGGRITGLTNNVTYTVVVLARSQGNNQSDASNSLTGTPVDVLDFWRSYKQDGGREQGGCATGAASLVALLALAPLALRVRRRRS
jgi:hypothetical protein